MNWHKIQATCPLAYAAFLTWYMHTYPGYSQFEIRGDEEENELVAGFFDVPDSDVCLAEVTDPRDCYDFFDSNGIYIESMVHYNLTPVAFGFSVYCWEPDIIFECPSAADTRKEAEGWAFSYTFQRLEEHLEKESQTTVNN